MDKNTLQNYLETIDANLTEDVTLYIYGSGAQILLGENMRTSLDLDVAGPYCSGHLQDFREAAESAGLPVNPESNYQDDHIEWIGALRLCLPEPSPQSDMVLWQGNHLAVRTVSPARLIASKLIRYDDSDQSDIRFLVRNTGVTFSEIQEAVKSLPQQFRNDTVVQQNLDSLHTDMQLWRDRS